MKKSKQQRNEMRQDLSISRTRGEVLSLKWETIFFLSGKIRRESHFSSCVASMATITKKVKIILQNQKNICDLSIRMSLRN